jgi:hemerythrin-like domain-containing protein
MNSVDNLRDDHESMVVFSAILEKILNDLSACRPINVSDLRWLFLFFRDFVIKNHFRKEEWIMSRYFSSLGLPRNQVDLLKEEHEVLCNQAKLLRGLVEDLAEGRDYAGQDLLYLGNAYLDLINGHLQKEESVFFPLVEEFLSLEMDDRISDRLTMLDEEITGTSRQLELLEMLNCLMGFYGIEVGSQEPDT